MTIQIKTKREQCAEIVSTRSAKLFDYLIKEGWIELKKGKVIHKDSFTIENFTDGKDFGKIFSKYIELGLEELF